MCSSSSSSPVLIPLLLAMMLLLAIVLLHQVDGQNYGCAQSFNSSSTVPSSSDFTCLKEQAGYKAFSCIIYNGQLVTDASTYTYAGFQAGINQKCINALNNGKAEPHNYFMPGGTGGGQMDAIIIAKFTASNATTNYYNPPWSKQTWDPVKLQIKVALDALNAVCTPNCVVRTYLVVLQTYKGITIAWNPSNPTSQTDNQRFVTKYLSYWPVFSQNPIGVLSDTTPWQALLPTSYKPVDSNGQTPYLWQYNTYACTHAGNFVPFGGWTTSFGPIRCTMADYNVNQCNFWADQYSYSE